MEKCLCVIFLADQKITRSWKKFRASYWAIQAGLTPLTFAQHRLSPLAAFTSVRTFFTMECVDSEFANFTLPTLKAFLEARSHNVSGNKQ